MAILTIARFTLHELSRKKMLLGVLVLSGLFLILYAVGMNYLADELRRHGMQTIEAGIGAMGSVLALMAFYVLAFMAALLAVFTSIGTVASEVDTGTLQAVVPKPIRRWEIISGKWLGYVAMVTVYVVFTAAALILITNAFTGFAPPSPIPAILLLLLQSYTLLTLSLFGSTFLSALATGVAVFMLYGVGWVGGLIESIGTVIESQVMTNIGILTSLLIPSDVLWKSASYYLQPKFMIIAQSASSSASSPFASSTPPAMAMVVYAVIYIGVVFGLAQYVFAKKDL